jgi:DinB superfamily
MTSELLIQNCIALTQKNLLQAQALKKLSEPKLNWKENQNAWCILECIEHLNLYSDHYLPLIKNALEKTTTKSEVKFKHGLLGKYFSNMMLPKAKLNKMKTAKKMNPINAQLSLNVIDKFLRQQEELLQLLNDARKVNLNTIKIKTSISSLIRLRLGDTFEFVVNHNVRHLQQAERVRLKL